MGVSQLNVHKYRFSPTNENTACPACLGRKEDEGHFVFRCPLYQDIRQQYKLNVDVGVNLDKALVSVLACNSQASLVNIAKFLLAAFKLRQNFIENMSN